MAQPIPDDRAAEAEQLRPYVEVQLALAATMAERAGRPFADACLEFTNLHRRLGFGRPTAGGPAPAWLDFAAGLQQRAADAAERLDWTLAVFRETEPEAPTYPRFGCFSFDPPDAQGQVRIHFGNRDSADGLSPLHASKAQRRIADLRAMFAHLRAHHPDARSVKGGSWLYNLDAYCRLFPPEYVAARVVPDAVRLDGTSTWGQLLDFCSAVKPAVRQTVLANLDRLDPAAPWLAFPLRALHTTADIEHFHRFYDR